jgi:hypothetical protein
VNARVAKIDRNGKFGPINHLLIPWTARQTADQMQRFLGSFSHWMALDDDTRTDLFEAVGHLINTTFGGAVDRPFLTAVYTGRRL